MRKFSRILLISACAAAVTVGPTMAQSPVSPELVQSCEACHGKNGDSKNADVPRLNGQDSRYLLTRLKQFLDPTRGTPHSNQMMWQNATRVSDDEAAALAQYFGSQRPTLPASSGTVALTQAGVDIYRKGVAPGIPPCAGCHGQDGEGRGSAPRISGQHNNYLVNQLQALMLGLRVDSPMNHHTWSMTLDQMNAVAAYLSNN